MDDFYFKIVPIKKIDINNEKFRISIDKNTEVICDSIKEFGIINPPILKKEKNQYIIISGFKRVSSCLKLGHDSICSRIIETDDIYFCHKLAILDNSSIRVLGFIEIVNSIRHIKKFFDDKVALSVELSKLLNFKKGDKFFLKLLKILSLPEKILSLIDSGHVSFSLAEEFKENTEKEVDLFMNIFEKIKMPANFQKDIFNLINEIKLKEKKENRFILEDVINFIESNTDNKLDDGRSYKELRNFLIKRRFPEKTLYHQIIKNKIDRIILDKNLILTDQSNGDWNFFKLHINFDTMYEFDELIEKIIELRSNDSFNDLFCPM